MQGGPAHVDARHVQPALQRRQGRITFKRAEPGDDIRGAQPALEAGVAVRKYKLQLIGQVGRPGTC